MLLRLIQNHAEFIQLIIVVPNLNLSTRRGFQLTQKWMKTASLYFYYLKFVEIGLDSIISRFRKTTIANVAKNRSIKVVQLKSQNDGQIQEELSKIDCDYLFSMGPAILSKGTISIPKQASINVHGGELPKYRGLSNYVWMLIAKEKFAVVTMHEIIEKIDAGRNIQEIRFEINPDWSAFRLNFEMAERQADLARNFIDLGFKSSYSAKKECTESKYHGLPTPASIRQLKRLDRKLITMKDLRLLFKY